MRGARKIPTWNAEDIGSSYALQKMGIAALSSPPDMGRDCQFFEGSVDDQAEKLAEVFVSLK